MRVYDVNGPSVTVEAKAYRAPANPAVVDTTFKAAVEVLVVAAIEGEGSGSGSDEGDSGQDW
ncbi:hypothetical protein AB0C52_12580 [Streptomyces sp. NPDC048717]|uniref:hypothetical protein n=1 Tax=Streptomyces sp. NPDC048717 TaxID=3154928 RepID=UPI00343CE1A0